MIKLFFKNKFMGIVNFLYDERKGFAVTLLIMVAFAVLPFIGWGVIHLFGSPRIVPYSDFNIGLTIMYGWMGLVSSLILWGVYNGLNLWISYNIHLAKNGIEVGASWKGQTTKSYIIPFSQFDKKLKKIIQQGNQDQYKALIKTIVKFQQEEYTEDNLPTAEGFFLEMVNEALDDMWARSGVKRNMAVYKRFIAPREENV